MFIQLLANGNPIVETLTDFFELVLDFFEAYGEIGLFIYSIIETITPMAGVELILFPVIIVSPMPWWFTTLNIVVANTIGAFIVYFFLAKEDNRFYNRLVKKKTRDRAKRLFDRYGFWAIFIFALTPLPFFLILFTASVAKMKFVPYMFAAFSSRATRFFIITYSVHVLGGQTSDIILWLALIGGGMVLLMMFLQRRALAHFEKKAGDSAPTEDAGTEGQDNV